MANALQDHDGAAANAPFDDPVYQYLDRLRAKSKPYYVYMTANANKFLCVFYDRVNEYLCGSKNNVNAHPFKTSVPINIFVVGLFFYTLLSTKDFHSLISSPLDFLFSGYR